MTNDTTPAPIGADVLRERLLAAAPKAAPDEQPGAAYAELPQITADDRSFLHYNPNTDDVVKWVLDYARAAITADRAMRAQAAPAAVARPSERVAFEMWVRKSTTEVPHRDQYGFYDEPVSEWWKVWQARAAAQAKEGATHE